MKQLEYSSDNIKKLVRCAEKKCSLVVICDDMRMAKAASIISVRICFSEMINDGAMNRSTNMITYNIGSHTLYFTDEANKDVVTGVRFIRLTKAVAAD